MYETVKDEITRTAAGIKKAAEEEVTMSRKMISLKVTAAFLAGLVLGMLISPRKKVSYKIASDNKINQLEEDDYDEDYDEDEPANRGNTIKF